jgi:deferrochelatase/peroxidase EfeB
MNDTLTRRVLRRGILFGQPLPDPAPPNDDGDRGLLFLCYQASIEQQFEVIMQNWVNASDTPKPGGHDPLIGQVQQPNGSRDRFVELPPLVGPAVAPVRLPLPRQWVIPTGGGYFFVPALSALRDRLCRQGPVAPRSA